MGADVIRLAAFDCITPLGDAEATWRALCEGKRALERRPVRGQEGGDLVPLALMPGRALDETTPPSWITAVRALLRNVDDGGWGGVRRPVCIASSNFGVGSLYAFRRSGNPAHLQYGAPHTCINWLRRELGWGENVATFSHACVSAHVALLHASRLLQAGAADDVLVFCFDFVSPFVAGGFHALKILNGEMPAPYQDRPVGAIALGDGSAYAVLTRDRGDVSIQSQSLFNEMHHFTANNDDASGFRAVLEPLARSGRKLWLKGHGTGTLEAGRMESSTFATAFPNAPLVGWKGSLGHTLGSCGLVELALAAVAMQHGRTPGTIGTVAPTFAENVVLESFDNQGYDGVLCASNAFGGAHAALLLSHA